MSVFDRFSLKGRVAVVTGGAGLLGTQHAAALLEAGAKVVLLDTNESKLKSAVDLLQNASTREAVLGLCTDITSEEEVKAARSAILSQWKQDANILVNNAAIDPKFDPTPSLPHPSRLENFPLNQWNLELSVGITGAFICSRVFGSPMAEHGSGSIINVASDLGVIAPDQRIYKEPGRPDHLQRVKPATYSVVKHGLIGLTKYLSTYWADRGVRCNTLAPGGVYNQHSEEFLSRLTPLIPMGRMAHLDEYQAAILFLASDASSYMTGSTLSIDGGRTVW